MARGPGTSVSPEEAVRDLVAAEAEVLGHVGKNAAEGADAQRGVLWDGHVVLAARGCREA
jgi:hypothetical protein